MRKMFNEIICTYFPLTGGDISDFNIFMSVFLTIALSCAFIVIFV